jgi:hypothetical protein
MLENTNVQGRALTSQSPTEDRTRETIEYNEDPAGIACSKKWKIQGRVALCVGRCTALAFIACSNPTK